MSIVSGGILTSPRHRVLSPDAAELFTSGSRLDRKSESSGCTERNSVVYFYYPNYTAKIPKDLLTPIKLQKEGECSGGQR